MATTQRMVVKLQADVKDLQRKFKDVNKQMGGLASDMKRHGTAIGTGFGTAGLAVGAGLGFAVKKAADFEQKMQRVSALSGATGKDFDSLEQTALDLGASTAFSASQAAEGMGFLAMAGFETNDIISAMPGLLDTAAAGQMDLGQTADIVSNILTGFGMAAEDTGNVADILSKTFTSSNTDLSMLGETMKYAAPVAASLGMDLQDAATAAAFMGDAGVQGSMAGTSLAGGLSRLANPVAKADKAMKKLGFTAIDNKGNFKSMGQIVRELSDKTKGMTKAQKTATLTQIFGQEAAKGWLAVIARGPEEFDKYRNSLDEAGGTAQRVADTQMQGLNGQLTILGSAFEGAAISLGNALLPAITFAAEVVTGLVNKFNSLSERTKSFIAIGAAVTAALLLLASVVGFVVAGIGMLMTVAWAAVAPILGIVVGVTALIAALVIAYAKFEWFRNAMNTVFQFIKQVAITVFQALSSFIQAKLAEIMAWWTQYGGMIQQAATNVWNVIWQVIQFIMPIILSIIVGTWNAIKGAISGAINVILGIIQFFAALFTGNWGAMWDAVKRILSGALQLIWNLILLTLGRVLKYIGKFAGMGLKAIGKFATGIGKWFGKIAQSAVKWFQKIGNTIKTKIDDAANAAARKISSFSTDLGVKFLQIFDKAKSIFGKVKNAILNPIKEAKEKVLGIISKIKGAFEKLKIKIPKPKIPKLSVDFTKKSFLGMDVPIPNFNLDWYKTGGMFNGPSMIGVGEQPGVSEVAMPLSGRHMLPFAKAVAENMPGGAGGGGGEYVFNLTTEIDGRKVARQTSRYDEQELERRKTRRRRAEGKVYYD